VQSGGLEEFVASWSIGARPPAGPHFVSPSLQGASFELSRHHDETVADAFVFESFGHLPTFPRRPA